MLDSACPRSGVKPRHQHFGEIATQSLEGIATNTLADHLIKLVAAGLLSRHPDPTHRQKVIYRLTEPSIQLVPAIVALGRVSQFHATSRSRRALRGRSGCFDRHRRPRPIARAGLPSAPALPTFSYPFASSRSSPSASSIGAASGPSCEESAPDARPGGDGVSTLSSLSLGGVADHALRFCNTSA